MHRRANLSRNCSLVHLSLIWGPSKVLHPFPEGSRQPSHSLVIMCISPGSTVIFPKSETAMLSICFSLFQKHFTCKRPAPLYTHLQEASPFGGSFARFVCSYLWFVLCHCLLLYVVCRCLLLIFVIVNHCLSLFVAVCHLSLFVVWCCL